jgi:hypothetical protein
MAENYCPEDTSNQPIGIGSKDNMRRSSGRMQWAKQAFLADAHVSSCLGRSVCTPYL